MFVAVGPWIYADTAHGLVFEIRPPGVTALGKLVAADLSFG